MAVQHLRWHVEDPAVLDCHKFLANSGKDMVTKLEGKASVKIVGNAGKVKTLKQAFLITGAVGDKFVFSFYVEGKSIPSAGLCAGQVLLYNVRIW